MLYENAQDDLCGLKARKREYRDAIKQIQNLIDDYERQAREEIATGIPEAVRDGHKSLKLLKAKRREKRKLMLNLMQCSKAANALELMIRKGRRR